MLINQLQLASRKEKRSAIVEISAIEYDEQLTTNFTEGMVLIRLSRGDYV